MGSGPGSLLIDTRTDQLRCPGLPLLLRWRSAEVQAQEQARIQAQEHGQEQEPEWEQALPLQDVTDWAYPDAVEEVGLVVWQHLLPHYRRIIQAIG